MNGWIFGILTLFSINPALAQDMRKIVVTSQVSDEPPSIPGPPEYRLEFERVSDGTFTAARFTRGGIERGLPSVSIEVERIRPVETWIASGKREFTGRELDLNRDQIVSMVQIEDHGLHFPIPDEIVVDVDSFEFCQQYRMTKLVTTGGDQIGVSMHGDNHSKEFRFQSGDAGSGSFDLAGYLYCYTLLQNSIPTEFTDFNFFSKSKLMDVIIIYQKTIECEGFYFSEYADSVGLTGADRRSRRNWDFVQYLNQRRRR